MPDSEPTDEALMALAARGDSMAFGTLFLRYDARLVAFLTRFLGDRALAEDVAQEAFADAWAARTRFDPQRRPFRIWLYALAKNAARTAQNRRTRESRALLDSLPERPATDEAGRSVLSQVIGDALAKLPASQRAALVLTVYEGCSHREAAQVLGSNELAVRVLCHRARQNLRKRLAPLLESEEGYV